MIHPNNSFIVTYTKNPKEIESFWKTLNCKISEISEGKCVVKVGGFELHYVTDEPIEEYGWIKNEKNIHNSSLMYVEVSNLQAVYDALITLKTPLHSSIVSTPWGTQEFLFDDPDGNHFVAYVELMK